jgi:hypothetical protein
MSNCSEDALNHTIITRCVRGITIKSIYLSENGMQFKTEYFDICKISQPTATPSKDVKLSADEAIILSGS